MLILLAGKKIEAADKAEILHTERRKGMQAVLKAREVVEGAQAVWEIATKEKALSCVLEMIPPGAVVSRSGSVTLEEVGVIPAPH